ncbi:MarR family winged helix-turn-helix transcriptional regulator [Nocardia tengchongensis]|uniref:MarR family winged helix-turn-helix transcriptional regulator n=1 Tax=Nocardia tengchongensis TaxID=2055889 RepID=UPI0036B47BC5
MSELTSDPAELADNLQSVVGALVRRMRAASPRRAISLSQISILKRLDRDGPATVADLARSDKIRHQSVTTAASTLIDRDLIRRATDPTDLRRKLLELTPAGRELLTERREAGSGHLADLLDERMTATERKQLSQALDLLRRLID